MMDKNDLSANEKKDILSLAEKFANLSEEDYDGNHKQHYINGFLSAIAWQDKNRIAPLQSQLQEVTLIRDKYATAARVIALWLKDFCNEDLSYDEMIADAAREAAAQLKRLREENLDLKSQQHP